MTGNPYHDAKGLFASGPGGNDQAAKDKRAEEVKRQIKSQGRHGYNPESVNKAIESSNRAGRKIGGSEAKAIHALLKGRTK